MARVDELLKAIAVTAELTGTAMSETGARIFADDLRNYRLEDVLDALTRCRRELKSKLTVAGVIERIEYALAQRQGNNGPRNHDCEYQEGGMRCKYPGADAQNHKGPWYCRVHFRENGTLFAQQALDQSQSYREEPQPTPGDLLNADLKELTWLNENLSMLPTETRQEYNLRCRDKALSMLKGFKIKPMVNTEPERMREPGEDPVEA